MSKVIARTVKQLTSEVFQRRKDIARARGQWQAFLTAAPEFRTDMFNGRGIVILAGRLQYMAPAWINIHMLRRTGDGYLYNQI